ncbi:MAG: Slp family lipoprotein [Nitrospiraceae bacterium]
MASLLLRTQQEASRWLSKGLVVWTAILMAEMDFVACSTIPSKYVKQAEPGVTLTLLTSRPDAYRGKVVVLGGAVVFQRDEDGRVWLLVRNRPLDADYVPHIPASVNDPDGGAYWVVVPQEGPLKNSRNWSRLTVVGRVSDERPAKPEPGSGKEPVLVALYMRVWGSGWGGYGSREDVWADTQDAGYLPSAPKPLSRNSGGGP